MIVFGELHLSQSVRRLTQTHKLVRSLESHTPGVAGWTVVSKYDGWPVTQCGEWMMESVRARNTGRALRFQTSQRLTSILTSELKPGWFECGFVLSQNPSNWVNSSSQCCVPNPSELSSKPSEKIWIPLQYFKRWHAVRPFRLQKRQKGRRFKFYKIYKNHLYFIDYIKNQIIWTNLT